jgi:signal transduction histidine kinase
MTGVLVAAASGLLLPAAVWAASADPSVTVPYWQTSEFLILVGLNFACVSGLLYYGHLQGVKSKQAALEAFSRRLIESQEAERKRIASELHDSLGQELLVIKNQALLCLRDSAKDNEARAHLSAILAAASSGIEEVRAIAYALRPYQLDRLGLTRALDSMLRKVGASSGIQFTVTLDPIDGVFSKDSEISFYRIVQESVSNIVRHSQATEARVELHRNGDEVALTIADNGKGFSVGAEPGGFGLIGITERVRLLGGAAGIQSTPGAGTSIGIRVHHSGGANERTSRGSARRRPSDFSKRAATGIDV